MKKTKGNGTLQKKLVARVLLVFCLPLLLISVYALSAMSQTLYQNTLNSAETVLGTAVREIQYSLQSCVDQVSQLAYDASIINALSSRSFTDADSVHLILDQIKPFFAQMHIHNQEVKALRILHTNPKIFRMPEWLVTMDSDTQLLSLLRNENRTQRYTVSYLPFDRDWAVGTGGPIWCVDYAIMSTDGMLLGVVEATLDHRGIWGSAVNGLQDSGYDFFLLYGDEVIASTGNDVPAYTAAAPEGVSELKSSLLVKHSVEGLKASLCVCIPRSMISLSRDNLLLVAGVFSSIVVVAWLMVRAVCQTQLRDLNKLVDRMDEVSGVNLGDPTGEDDIQRLSRHFEGMYSRLNEVHSREKQLLYDDLTNELRPHFICNMMDQLRLQAEHLKHDELAQSIVHINQYFRYSMLGKDDLVPLGEEVENGLNYLKLSNAMRTDKISFDASMDNWAEEHLKEAKMPRLLLQPLLENAVRHGIGKMRNGYVYISVKREDTALVITVEDNGNGISEEEVARLNSLLESANEAKNGKHLGLLNVKRRLNLVFAERNSLIIRSAPYEGTSVTIRMEDPETKEDEP